MTDVQGGVNCERGREKMKGRDREHRVVIIDFLKKMANLGQVVWVL